MRSSRPVLRRESGFPQVLACLTPVHGPLTVEPAFRERGVGQALIERALSEARNKGHGLVILVGDEPYYGKLGFKRAPPGRIILPGPVDPERLLYCEMQPGAFEGVAGKVRGA